MAQPRWKSVEDQVRGIAELIFGAPCEAGRLAGVNFDGIIKKSDLEIIVFEVSLVHELNKVREGITRIGLCRQTQIAEGILVRGYIVLAKTPTQSMLDAAKESKINVISASQLSTLFFNFNRYKNARMEASFGSSIDPISGKVDKITYVPVTYKQVNGDKDLSLTELSELLLSGKNVVLLGEYGSGKSRCIRELFSILSQDCHLSFKFPFAINLRECWGLDRSDEIIRRSMYVLGQDELVPAAVRAFNQNSLILLLDGFDETGSQSWSTDEGRIRQLRALALKGAKDLISRSKIGCLIAGREHYFSSNDEMLSAFGLNAKNTIVLKANDEFSDSELEAYFDAAGLDIDLPSWLPKRPLICQTIALLSDDELGNMFGSTSGEVAFWNHFIKIVCQRDARINTFFDAETIYSVFVALSRITRTRPSNVGPLSQRDLQDAFESVVGQLPVEDASVMLQRLPSLGRIGAESYDRQFVDMFILDGLRAKDVSSMIEKDDSIKQRIFQDTWTNPLGPLGQAILAEDMSSRLDQFRQIAARATTGKNPTLAADITSGMARIIGKSIDMHGLNIVGGDFSELTLNLSPLSNLTISESTFERLILPNSPPNNVLIIKCIASKVSGAASFSGLPSWVKLDIVDDFDSVQTVSQIKKVGLSPAHEIAVAILKKTFKQRGGGRKEEALLRGFGSGASYKLASSVLNLLMRENFLNRHKGDEGWVYTPNRNQTARIISLLDQLRSSGDPLWSQIEELN